MDTSTANAPLVNFFLDQESILFQDFLLIIIPVSFILYSFEIDLIGIFKPVSYYSFQVRARNSAQNGNSIVGVLFRRVFINYQFFFINLGPANNKYFGSENSLQSKNYPAKLVFCPT